MRFLCGVSVGLAAAACGGVARDEAERGGVATPGAGGAHAGGESSNGGISFGGTGAAPSSGTGGDLAMGGIPGASAAGAGGAVNCTQTKDRVTIDVTPKVAVDGGAELFTNVDYSIEGRVVGNSLTTFDVDSCPAGAHCDEQVVQFTVDAPELNISWEIYPDSLVHVHYAKSCGYGCVSDIAVTSLDSWGGYVNPVPALTGLYLAADDGGGSVSEMPYKVDRILLDCDAYPRSGVCAENAGLYALKFTFGSDSFAAPVVVHMGEEYTVNHGAYAFFRIRNLRSFETGQCDNYTNWGHFIVDTPPPR